MVHQDVELKRGLRDVYFESTESSFVIGDVGRLIYRGYDIHDLAENASFEEVVYLMMIGHLPNRSELQEFDNTLRASRSIPDEVIQVIDKIKDGHPMDVLRTIVSSLAAFELNVDDTSHDSTLRKGMKITAQVPTIVAAHHRLRSGLSPIEPDNNLSHAANFLYMLLGNYPDEDTARLMDKDLIVHLDHGSNASSFAARVTASTLADVHGAIVTGISTLKGPLHGGAAEGVMKMALDIGEVDNVQSYLEGKRERKERIMGFGHAVYRAEDPRARHLREGSRLLAEKKGDPKWFQILSKVEEHMRPYAERGICVNVDFWAGSVYYLLGIPEDLFISIFAVARVPGYVVQILEQQDKNMLIRPQIRYDGPLDLEFVPIDQRS
ncbi:MAG: citrate (Si)-synthase [Chloroflexi bacterium]|jgi:citrate synthase|nr:citrate (Si)-synthase [Chloroflexota bacterium]MBN86615.1 citrate (Si)-synthase [Dehalococcoidia bacterium]|tara:strand:+ start:418 stop:1557 length:1140 start_codon:yes stop_codon:yes gene_type:complete